MNINSLPIGAKLALVFALIGVLNITVILYCITEVKKDKVLIAKMFHYPYIVSNAVKTIHTDILNIYLLAQSIALDKEKLHLETATKRIEKSEQNINKNFILLYKHCLGSKDHIDRAYTLYKKLTLLRVKYLKMIKKNSFEEARLCLIGKDSQNMENFLKEISILGELTDTKAKSFLDQAQEKETNTLLYLKIALIISVLLGLLISAYAIRLVVLPIRKLISSTRKIIDGDTTSLSNCHMPSLAKREDELGQLYNLFCEAMNDLLLPYENIIKSKRPLIEKSYEVQRLLQSFDKYIIASKTNTHGKIIYVSKAFQDISGYSAEELLGQPQSIVNHPDMPKETFKNLWERIRNGKTWNGFIKNKKKDGTFFWIRSSISPDIDSMGNIVGYNAISENVTDTKAYEELSKTLENIVKEKTEKNNEQTVHMIQQSRLAQMGEMISMIAHQWRQPLASISAISGTLSLDIMMKNYNEEFFEERLNSIAELSQHLSKTIDDFRSFFKNDKKREKALLQDVVDSCLQIIGHSLINKNLNLILDIEKEAIVNSYISELKQVILNILKNAEDALIEAKIEGATIWIKGYKNNSNVYLSIEDNAGGVPETIIDKVFDPYFSTKKQKDGTGLGLYMSKIIIEEHIGGTIKLTNSDVGACFTIVIPV